MLVMSVCSEYINSYEAKHCYDACQHEDGQFDKVTTIENDDNRKWAF